jgi:formylmethanofuran dehydrogenase subunit E
MSKTIFGDPVPTNIRCDQCQEVRTDCVALDESTTAVTGRRFLCVPCAQKNTRRFLDIVMSEGDPWKEETV